MNALVTLVTMMFGDWITSVVNPDSASYIGAAIFMLLGGSELYKFAITQSVGDKKAKVEVASSGIRASTVSVSETIALGVGLCATNVAGGAACIVE